NRQAALLGFFLDRAGDAMRGEDDGAVRRHLRQLLHEYGSEAPQTLDDVMIVDDLVPDVDRTAEQLDRALDDVDRPIDPCAETTWIGEYDFHAVGPLAPRPSRNASSSSNIAPMVMQESATLKAGNQ